MLRQKQWGVKKVVRRLSEMLFLHICLVRANKKWSPAPKCHTGEKWLRTICKCKSQWGGYLVGDGLYYMKSPVVNYARWSGDVSHMKKATKNSCLASPIRNDMAVIKRKIKLPMWSGPRPLTKKKVKIRPRDVWTVNVWITLTTNKSSSPWR